MAQADGVVANGTGSAVRADINGQLAALFTNHSGSTEPATTFAFQTWADTTSNTLKLRNSSNDGWIQLARLDGQFDAKTFNGNITLNAQSDLRLADSDSSNWVAFQAPATVASNVTWTLPAADGTSGQTLQTNGSGTLSWSTPSATVDKIEEGNTSAEVVDTGSDGHFKVVTEGVEALRVDSSQRVGIGVIAPSQLLEINGASTPSVQIKDTTNNVIARIGADDNVAKVGSRSNHPVQFQINDGEVARLDTSGRLLVGTSTARTNFFATTYGGPLQIETANNNSNRTTSITYGSSSNAGPLVALAKHRSTSVGGQTIVQNGDETGILSFQGSDGTNFMDTARIEAFVDGTPGTNDMPGRLVFSTTADGASSPTERMRITNTGFLKATSTNGSNYANVAGLYHELRTERNNEWVGIFSHATGGNPYGINIYYQYANPTNTASQFIYCNDNVATRFEVRSNGGIANFQSNNVNLCDEREKKNIVNLDSTWDCLKNWELKKFHYNEDADDADLRYGVIAQQVAPHCPEVITDWVKQKAEDAVLDDDGNVVTEAKEEIVRMGVKEQQMMWMAIKALQEAQTRIETLETANASLEARLTALENA